MLILRPQGLFAERWESGSDAHALSFQTDYQQDMSLSRHPATCSGMAALAILLAIPLLLGEFYVGELGGVFIFAIAGVGLMLLAGYTGLVNLARPRSLASALTPTPCC